MRVTVESARTITSTNVDGSLLTEWSSATTYTTGQQVKFTSGQSIPHHEFESLIDDNTNNPPVVGGTSKWLDLGATNQHRMFDGLNNSRTVATDASGGITVTVGVTTRVQTLALIGLRNVKSVIISQIVGGSTANTITRDMTVTYDRVGWWSWLFGERSYGRSCVVDLAGIYTSQSIQIQLVSGGGVAQCGMCLIGKSYDLGDTQWGAQPGLRDFSTFEEDEFGNTQFVPRQNKRLGDYTIWCDTPDFDRVFGILEDLIGSLALFDANNHQYDTSNFDSIRAYGKIESVSTGLAYGVTPIDIRIVGMN
jgi:hypothetical protein